MSNSTEISRFLSTAQAAKYLGVSQTALRSYVHKKIIPVHRLGPRLFKYDVAELDIVVKTAGVVMHGDGHGWVRAVDGERLFGRYGVAGLLLAAAGPDEATGRVAATSSGLDASRRHLGYTSRGARQPRERRTGRHPRGTRRNRPRPDCHSVTGSVVTSRPAGTEWTYTTVLAATHTTPTLAGSADSAELAWVPVADGSTWRCTLAWPRAGHKLRSVVCARPQ